jgi:hypothetical protein
MFCKQSETVIKTLLSLKVDDSNSKPTKTINLIGSYEDSIPGNNIGRSASAVTSHPQTNYNRQMGEVAELKSMLKLS